MNGRNTRIIYVLVVAVVLRQQHWRDGPFFLLQCPVNKNVFRAHRANAPRISQIDRGFERAGLGVICVWCCVGLVAQHRHEDECASDSLVVLNMMWVGSLRNLRK